MHFKKIILILGILFQYTLKSAELTESTENNLSPMDRISELKQTILTKSEAKINSDLKDAETLSNNGKIEEARDIYINLNNNKNAPIAVVAKARFWLENNYPFLKDIHFLEFKLTQDLNLKEKAELQLELALRYQYIKKMYKAFILFKSVAESKFADKNIKSEAKLGLAELYDTGFEGKKRNEKMAIRLYKSILKNPLDASRKTRAAAQHALEFINDKDLDQNLAVECAHVEELVKKVFIITSIIKKLIKTNTHIIFSPTFISSANNIFKDVQNLINFQHTNKNRIFKLYKYLNKLETIKYEILYQIDKTKNQIARNKITSIKVAPIDKENVLSEKNLNLDDARKKLEADMPTLDLNS